MVDMVLWLFNMVGGGYMLFMCSFIFVCYVEKMYVERKRKDGR